MTPNTRFLQLSKSRQAMARILQSVNFGSIRNLEVRNGEPIFDPMPALLMEVKLDSEAVPRPEIELADFELRAEVIRFFAQMDRLGSGVIERIDVRFGIPWRVVLSLPWSEVRPS